MSTTHSEFELEAIRICQELIRIPSVNYGEGKGDEKAVADYIAALLSEVGIEPTIYESAPGRCNVIARIKGSNSERAGLVVHGHIDVVPANADDWSVDPFSGVIKDGFIWGRGAVDMKNMDAMILATVRDWKRTGYIPERDIVLAFFADEEAGSIFGSHFMVKNHPEVFAGCTEAVSEVGGFSVTVTGGKRLYLIETAEKGIHWMRLTAQGKAGHGSMMNDDNAITRLAEAVVKIGRFEWPQRYSKTVKAFFKRIAEETGKPYNEEDLRPLLKNITVETITRDKALEVPFEGDLVEAMCNALIKEDSVAIPVPYVMSGGTDNKALADLGIIGYGFSPLKLDADFNFMAMFHGVDERVPVEGLAFGTRVLKDFLEHA